MHTLLFNSVIIGISPANECHCKPISRMWSINAQSLGRTVRFELQIMYFESVWVKVKVYVSAVSLDKWQFNS